MAAIHLNRARAGATKRRGIRRAHQNAFRKVSPDGRIRQFERLLERHLIEIATHFVTVLRRIGYADKQIIDEIIAAASRRRPQPSAAATPHLGYWARVLARWAEDPRFVSEQGVPRDLPNRGPESFASLVEAELPGEDPNQGLRVLTATRAITRLPNGKLRWRSRAAISGDVMNVTEVLRPLRSLLINLQSPYDAQMRPFTRGVSGFAVTRRDAIDLRRLIEVQGMMFLEIVDNWLRQRANRRVRGKAHARRAPARLVRPFVGLIMNCDGDLPTRLRSRGDTRAPSRLIV